MVTGFESPSEIGAKVEAQQLAGYVVGPWAVDGALTHPGAKKESHVFADI